MTQKSRRNRNSTACQSEGSIAAPLADAQQFVIRQDWQCQYLEVSPPCPELQALLKWRNFIPTDDPRHGFGLKHCAEPLFGPGCGVANGGLAPVIGYELIQLGHLVKFDSAAIRRLPPPIKTALPEPANQHVIDFIYDRTHGVIAHSLCRSDMVLLCLEMALAFPTSRFTFIAPTREVARAFYVAFRKVLSDATLAFPNNYCDSAARIVVATNDGLKNANLLDYSFDVLVFLDATTAVGETGQTAMFFKGQPCLFGFLRLDYAPAPRVDDLLMAAFGPERLIVPSLGYEGREVHVVWLRVTGRPSVHKGSTHPSDIYRRGIVFNHIRNRRLARLARALAGSDRTAIAQICPAAQLASDQNSVVVIAGTVEHAIEIARRLPGWQIMLDESANLAGLTTEQRAVVDAHRHCELAYSRVIVTTASMASFRLGHIDTVIWAAGGTGLPSLSIQQLASRAASSKTLLLIDVDDRHHRELHRAAASRRKAYAAAGWPPVGTSPAVSRIKQFLAQRPRTAR